MNSLIALFYNVLVFPLLFILFHIYALVHRKTRRGLIGRYQSRRKALRFRQSFKEKTPEIFLIHCASMGEFEHIKPFVRELKEQRPDSYSVVMFFSPSGYENVQSAPGVDLFIYTPFDSWFCVRRLFRVLEPAALIISKYDVWPNLIWAACSLGIPRFLINATLQSSSTRLRIPALWLNRLLYREFTRILTISPENKSNYVKLAPAEIIDIVGDTKYDQVIYRSRESRQKKILPISLVEGKRILVFGSTWPEDETHFIPALKHIFRQFDNVLAIICPHEPSPEHLHHLEAGLKNIPACRLSRIENFRNEPVILVDRIGVLANLYSLAEAAYVGGGFKQNVHNILEPAVYGIPVFFGPVNQNSYEAYLLKHTVPDVEVADEQALETRLTRVLTDNAYRESLGNAALELVEENCGATERTVKKVLENLGGS